jgi:hypothetical protein
VPICVTDKLYTDESVSEHDLEDAFSRFGPIIEIWLASYAPFYAFVKFKVCRM